jgi:3-oxoacyl-[acyl-carrier-protein] synthase II
MNGVALIAAAGFSALGSGRAAWSVGEAGAAAQSAIGRDEELARVGLRRPFSARIAGLPAGAGDRAARLLGATAGQLGRELDRSLPGWRTRRLALAIGTSGGGMPSLVEAFGQLARGAGVPPELARAAPYFGPLAVLEPALGARFEPCVQVLAACASSTLALGLGARWLESGVAELVIAGGYDALCPFIAAGFEVLGATSETPAPFRMNRNGMALGEGAALIAMLRADQAPAQALGYLLGFGASSDAVHVTAPDREGRGLARAGRAALDEAALEGEIGLVSAHGTATPYNDSAESRAILALLGDASKNAVVHPFKAVIGHTLGAAGALELLAALDALERGVLPAAVGTGPFEPDFPARLLEHNLVGRAGACLKLSAAFGGANAALVAARDPRPGRARSPRPVSLAAIGESVANLELDAIAAVSAHDRTKLARIDPLSGLVATAVAALIAKHGPLPAGTGVVVGSVAATIEIDELFDRRCRERGHRSAEPRRFPPTSPNLCAGECTIAFGLTGPSLAVGAGPAAPLEALLVAYDLLQAGDAPALVVVAADDVGRVVRSLWRSAGWPEPAAGAAAVLLGHGPGRPIERGSLARCHAEARAAGGKLGGSEPGWPALLGALTE